MLRGSGIDAGMSLLNPKSPILKCKLTSPVWVANTLLGFKSRCIICLSCTCCNPLMICSNIVMTSPIRSSRQVGTFSSFSFRARIQSARVVELHSSICMYSDI